MHYVGLPLHVIGVRGIVTRGGDEKANGSRANSSERFVAFWAWEVIVREGWGAYYISSAATQCL